MKDFSTQQSVQEKRFALFGRGMLLWTMAAVFLAAAAENINPPVKRAVVISCHEMIDNGLYQSIVRRGNQAVEQGADYLILDISTYGGLVESADDISKYLILDIGKRIHTVAYVSTEAISAGAMISTSCKDIIMRENTTIGCSAPVSMGGQIEGAEREKIESFVRAAFSRAAQANGYPEALLKAMVSQNLEVWQVRNKKTGQNEYFEKEYLPADPNTYDLDNRKLIVKEGELLTLTASKALEYGIARAVVPDLEGAIAFLEKRDGVVFERPIPTLETTWSEEMVRFLNSPLVVSILILGILLGIYVELNTPGIGLPSLVALICLIILVGSKYLIGMANWIEIAFLLLGIVLLLIEIFIIPGFGLTGAAGIFCILAGLFGMLIKNAPDEFPWPQGDGQWKEFLDNLTGVSLGFLLFIVIAYLLAKYVFPKGFFVKGLVLKETVPSASLSVIATGLPEHQEKTLQPGDIGKVVSTCRPAGQARFGDKIVDVVSEAEFIEPGKTVVICRISGNRVIVKEQEKKE
ncbi:MAG TPA: NfeD family protein [Anaerohalosphaeraceae bacterium]|nr:NfeD family protein [Anaerohalosphaeraceae bacterium]HOL88631.1 NfeD family protein [Anaerohalosphaeraceae bacterium]HPP56221.1 NfeD family protein [Anaerohalosphaeraceae bacterium]